MSHVHTKFHVFKSNCSLLTIKKKIRTRKSRKENDENKKSQNNEKEAAKKKV
jgi:hypothetical protein